jgi:hypothetical protein
VELAALGRGSQRRHLRKESVEMKFPRTAACLVLATVTACQGTSNPDVDPPPPLVLTGGTVIVGSDLERAPDTAVVVEDGVITDIGPAESVTTPEGAVIVDVGGLTVMPGLIDARASLLLNHIPLVDGGIEAWRVDVYLRPAIDVGLTTLRAVGSSFESQQNDAEALRDALDALGNSIPTIVNAGPGIGNAGGLFEQHYADAMVPVSTVEEAARATDELIDLGVDQVSYGLTAGQDAQRTYARDRSGLPPVLSRDQLETINATAHARDVEVVGQGMFPEEARLAVQTGTDQLLSWPVSSEPLPGDLIELVVTEDVPVVTGFNVVYPNIAEGDIRRVLDAGGTLVFGTFAPNSGPIDYPYREFVLMALQGMTPEEIVRSATVDAAGAVGLGDEVGTLEIGKRADIVVVNGEPLSDITALRAVTHVIKGGELVVQPAEAN